MDKLSNLIEARGKRIGNSMWIDKEGYIVKTTRAYDFLYDKYESQEKQQGVRHFGVPVWLGIRGATRLHYDGENFLVTASGHPCIEVGRQHYVILAPPQGTSGFTYTWDRIIASVTQSKAYKITRRLDKKLGVSISRIETTVGNVPFIGFCVIGMDGNITNTDFNTMRIDVDKERVTTFNKRLRNFFKPYEVLLRLGSHDTMLQKLCEGTRRSVSIPDLMKDLELQDAEKIDDKIFEMIESNTPMDFQLTTKYVLTRSYGYMFSKYNQPRFLAKTKNVKEHIRLTFARKCTRLHYQKYLPEAAYVKHQSVVLQSIDGLRTVPLQGKVEVYRPRSGTRKTVASGQVGARE